MLNNRIILNLNFLFFFIQMFKETAEQADGWLGTKEAFLANEDVGVCQFLSDKYRKKPFTLVKGPGGLKYDWFDEEALNSHYIILVHHSNFVQENNFLTFPAKSSIHTTCNQIFISSQHK